MDHFSAHRTTANDIVQQRGWPNRLTRQLVILVFVASSGSLNEFNKDLVEMEAAISLEMLIDESESELAQNCSLNHAVTMSDSSEQITKRDEWKRSAKQLQSEIYFAYFVCRHPRVRWYSKLLAAVAVGYVMSPIQLIPTFIPLVGVLDDLLVLVVAIKVMRRITPAEPMAECRAQAQSATLLSSSKILKHAAIFVGVLSTLIGSCMTWGCLFVCRLTGR